MVILSLSLPGPDGFLLLDAIQKERGAWDIPIIATGAGESYIPGSTDRCSEPQGLYTAAKEVRQGVGTNL